MQIEDKAAPLLPMVSPTTPPRVLTLEPARSAADVVTQLTKRVTTAHRARVAAKASELVKTTVALPAGSGYWQGRSAAIRSRLLGGAIHVVSAAGATSRLQTALESVDADQIGSPQFGSGGGIRVQCRVAGTRSLLRIGLGGTPADPSRHCQGLQAAASLPQAPRVLATGLVDTAVWCVESMLGGRPAGRINDERLAAAERFLRSMPETGQIESIGSATEFLTDLVAGDISDLRALSERAQRRLDQLPGMMTHGDFWLGNLLYRNGALTAVIDWDGWTTGGAPGTDLIHLFADAERRRRRTSYGAQVTQRLWRRHDIRDAIDQHLSKRDLPHDDATVDALGIAWWLTAVSNAMRRNPDLRNDETWIRRNISNACTGLQGELY